MSKKRLVDRKYLLALRKKGIKISQKEFSELVGIPVRTLRAYEKGERLLTADKFREIKRTLGYVDDSKGSLRVMIDYLRITFKNVTDLDWFCQQYLYCELKEFVSVETRLMMYSHLWRRGDIWIFDYADKSQTANYQITLQLSGAGCRQFELLMEREGKTWEETLQKMYFERDDMKVTRCDVAMDEMYKGYERESEHFKLSDMIDKVYRGYVDFDRLKKWNHIGGGSLKSDDDKQDDDSEGISIYFGSRQSDLYFNFYEKRYEFAKKEQMSVIEALEIFGVWNRYELRFSQGKAHKLIEEFVCGVDLAEIAKAVINKEIQVYDKTDKFGAFLPDKKWQSLFGGVEPLKLSVSPEPYSIEKTIKWLVYQVSNSLLLVDEADKILGTEYLKLIKDAGEITEASEEILAQLKPDDVRFIEEELGIR